MRIIPWFPILVCAGLVFICFMACMASDKGTTLAEEQSNGWVITTIVNQQMTTTLWLTKGSVTKTCIGMTFAKYILPTQVYCNKVEPENHSPR